MHRTNRFAYANIIQFYIDICALLGTYYLSYLIASRYTPMFKISQYSWILIIFVPLWTGIMALCRMYDRTTFYYPDRVMRNVVFATLFSSLSLGTMLYFFEETSTSRLFIAIFFILCILIMFI
ncbi:MAG: sugar transferase, partial [Firmicutes bacterium]|nr:sugar transferase [Bacillota bacterium]